MDSRDHPRVNEHVTWLLEPALKVELERKGALFVSGPLLSDPGTGPGSGVTVIRAVDEDAARRTARADPFVAAGLRTCPLHRWRLHEGGVGVRLSPGTGTHDWD